MGSIVFAHKTTEGWEALLTGMSRRWLDNYRVMAVFDRERGLGCVRESAALATSVHLVCRPRPLMDIMLGIGATSFRELPRHVATWMMRLEAEGVRGADLVFACIGPALEIYSHTAKSSMPKTARSPLAAIPSQRTPQAPATSPTYGRPSRSRRWSKCSARAPVRAVLPVWRKTPRLTALFLWTLQATDGEENGSTEGAREDGTEDTEVR